MKIILIGPPGSGKGTQAEKICGKFNVPHISTGDIFRQNMKDQTELGKTAKSYIDAGKLVPDSVTIDMVKQRLSSEDCAQGFLLDGFPRTLDQASAIDSELSIEKVIDIEVPDNVCVQRILGRAQQNGNDRADDNENTANERLKVYHSQTEPIIKHYEEKGVLVKIDGTKSIDEVWNDISSAF
ncbi:MAG: adenylate kinase [Nanoarchaeota archaeon]